MDVEKKFSECIKVFGIELSRYQIEQFNIFYKELIEWNEKINLTSIIDKTEVYLKHFIDSLSIIQVCKLSNQSIADIGTGGGFPGIPIKIAFPETHITFIDSSKKKMNVISDIVEKLNLDNCQIVDDNIENIGRNRKYREKYDIVTSRALGQFSMVLELGIPLLKINGSLFQYKGPNVEKEVENSQIALNLLDAKIKKTVEFQLPFSNIDRTIIVVEKIKETKDKYPRKAGFPKKRPL